MTDGIVLLQYSMLWRLKLQVMAESLLFWEPNR